MPLNLQLVSAEGDVIVPDRLKAEIDARAASVSVGLDVVAIDNQTWVTNPFTRRWQTLPGATLQDVADPAALISSLLESMQNPEQVGQAELDNVPVVRITGTVDSAVLSAALPIAQPGFSVNTEVWIGVTDSLPRRARIHGPLAGGEPENIVRQVDLTSFNQRLEIVPPE
jgi:hypothetical protein